MTPTTEAEARALVERELHGPLTDGEWLGAVQEGYFDEILNPDYPDAARKTAGWVRRHRGYFAGAGLRPVPRTRFLEEGLSASREQALSRILAFEATQDEGVQVFRREVLNDELLNSDQVETWIETQASTEQGPTTYVMIPAPPATRPGDTLTVPSRSLRIHRDLLTYPTQGPEGVRTRPVCIGGTLHRLQRLSESLARDFDWERVQAVTFVLTGAIPDRSSLTTTVRIGGGTLPPWKVILEADLTTSHAEIAERYRRLQSRFFGGRQYRSQSEKHLNLAVFVHPYLRDNRPRPTWAELTAEWNREQTEQPYWQYSDWRQFHRDARKAYRRLVTPGLTSAGWFRDAGEDR